MRCRAADGVEEEEPVQMTKTSDVGDDKRYLRCVPHYSRRFGENNFGERTQAKEKPTRAASGEEVLLSCRVILDWLALRLRELRAAVQGGRKEACAN